jgi:hypothetical protein
MPFEYRPFVNPYVGSMSTLMGRGVEARSRAELSAAEAQAGAAGRLGDITGAQWRGLGDTVGQGIDAYVTEQREAPIRKHAALLRADQLKQIAERVEGRERQQQAQALGGRITAGLDVQSTPAGDMLALQTDADGGFTRTDLAPDPSAEPGLLPAQTLTMDPSPYKTRDSRGLDLYDLEKITQQAMQAGVYDEFRPYFQALEGLNTRRVSRFDSAYEDFHGALKGSLGQPDALMSVAGELFSTFSQELGGSPRFQALLQNFERAQETGDPNVFQTAVRRDTDTPIDAPYQPDPQRRIVDIWSGVEKPATQEPDAIPFGSRENIKLQDGRVIEGAQAVRRGDRLEWRDPDGRTVSGVESVIDRVSGALTPMKRWQLAEDERRFPEAWRQALSMEWQTEGSTYKQAIETVRRLIAELATIDPAAASRVDPAIVRAYVKRLYDRPLTQYQLLLNSYFDRMIARGGTGNEAATEPPATGTGDQ